MRDSLLSRCLLITRTLPLNISIFFQHSSKDGGWHFMQIVPQKTYRFVINGRKIEALFVTYVVSKSTRDLSYTYQRKVLSTRHDYNFK